MVLGLVLGCLFAVSVRADVDCETLPYEQLDSDLEGYLGSLNDADREHVLHCLQLIELEAYMVRTPAIKQERVSPLKLEGTKV